MQVIFFIYFYTFGFFLYIYIHNKCKKTIHMWQIDFIEKAKKRHGDKYDYSKVHYTNSQTKVCIRCSDHGEFWQRPDKHLRGQGCPKCAHPNANMTTDEFIEKATIIHNGRYDYSKTDYKGTKIKVCIICPDHGEFWQTPKEHLKGHGCPKCKFEKASDTNRAKYSSEFIPRAREVHGDKYDYSKAEYVNNSTNVCIICPEHGEFWQTPASHLNGAGCPKCSKVYKPTTEEWIEKANEVHNGKYEYSKVEYMNAKTKVCIVCPDHGEFWQIPYAHLKGQGCPSCKMSHLENAIYAELKRRGVRFENESDLDGLLGRMRVDFWLPDSNTVIECQGGQHFYAAFDRRNKRRAEDIHQTVLKRDLRKRGITDAAGFRTMYFCSEADYSQDWMSDPKFQGLYTDRNLFCDAVELFDNLE